MQEKLRQAWLRIKNGFFAARKRISPYRKRALVFIDKRPFASFFVILGILLLLIIVSNILGATKPPETKKEAQIKQIKVYNVGGSPKLTVQAQIEKSGAIKITALTPGVVQTIYKNTGESFAKGETLIGMSSNYQGGNTSSLSRQLAQTQYNNALETYDTQKDIIQKQRELADKTDVNADELRNITSKSIDETKSLVGLNDDILKGIDQNLATLEANPPSSANDAMILSAKQLKTQFLAANNQARGALRGAEFSAASDRAPAELSNLSKDLTLKQLDVQAKMLDMNKEVSRIQLNIAQVAEGMMFPSAPFNGTVQRVFVKVGQQVNPGTELMVLSQTAEDDPITAIAYVSGDVAKKVSSLEESTLHIGDLKLLSSPTFVSKEAISSSLYGVYFDIPDQYNDDLTEKGFIQIDLPIGYADTSSSVPYIPLDAIYQTKAENFVFVVEKGVATPKKVQLGEVYGSFVEIKSGLSNTESIILNRNIIAGDRVEVE